MVLLKPFFPIVFHLTKVLDLSDSADRDIAAGHLNKILDFVAQPLPATKHPPLPPRTTYYYSQQLQQQQQEEEEPFFEPLSELGLSRELYYLKPIKNFFPTMGYANVSSSAMYFLQVMRVLHRDLECRQFVVFPYCFGQWKDEYGIVFPNLTGYRIGLPADPSLRHAFLTAGMYVCMYVCTTNNWSYYVVIDIFS
jgi:hypothetical protein